jgi:hypothetical protein
MPRLGAFVLSNYFAVIYVPVYSSMAGRNSTSLASKCYGELMKLTAPLVASNVNSTRLQT